MSASFGAASFGSRPELLTATYLRLRRMGFEGGEAANLAALKHGFAISSQPWTVSELTHLLFLRESRSTGRRWSDADDRADDSPTRTPASALAEPTAAAHGASPSPAGSAHRLDVDPSDGRVTLLTLFRAMAGANATLDLLRPSATPRPRLDAAGDADREGG